MSFFPPVVDKEVWNQTLANVLCWAAFENNAEAIKILMTSEITYPLCKLNDIQNIRGGISLLPHNSAIHLPPLLCDLLIHEPTPLMVACYMGSVETTVALLSKRATRLDGFMHFNTLLQRPPFWDMNRYKCTRLVASTLWVRLRSKALRIGKIALFVQNIFSLVSKDNHLTPSSAATAA